MLRSGTSKASRRNVLKGVGMATVGASLGASLPPVGSALAQGAPAAAKGPKLLEMEGKAKLAVLGDKPLWASFRRCRITRYRINAMKHKAACARMRSGRR